MSTNMSAALALAKAQVVAKPNEQSLSEKDKHALFTRFQQLFKEHNAVLVTHYYTSALLQELAEFTGGFIGDSLEMARLGKQHPASTLIVAGVRFMGETAKILSPDKRVLMPTLAANCSLDLGCQIDEFSAFCDAHPARTVVVYANTSAAVKARADWVVTSSIALPIVEHLDSLGEKILFAPDKHLGHYIQQQTGADMLLWQGTCIVHDTFKVSTLKALKAQYPKAAVLVHPEAPAAVIALADSVGSTTQLIKACAQLPHQQMIVATERNIFYKMQQAAPNKQLIQAPADEANATCGSCVHCPWMAMNDLQRLEHSLLTGNNEVHVDEAIAKRALVPLDRMVKFAEQIGLKVQGRA